MFNKLIGLFSYELAIDLGTSTTVVSILGRGTVVREPSLVARRRKTHEVLAVGTPALRMRGKTSKNIEVVSPLVDGRLSDHDAAVSLLGSFIKRAHESKRLIVHIPRPGVWMSVPGTIDHIHKRALTIAAKAAGASRVTLVPAPVAAIAGSVKDPFSGRSTLCVSCGAGVTEIACVAGGHIHAMRQVPVSGDQLTNQIIESLRVRYSLLIGKTSAEQLKMSLAHVGVERETIVVTRGRDLESGLPKSVRVSDTDIAPLVKEYVDTLSQAIRDFLRELSPDAVSDIVESGILLVGGGAHIRGLSLELAASTGISCVTPEDPVAVTVKGCAYLQKHRFIPSVYTS